MRKHKVYVAMLIMLLFFFVWSAIHPVNRMVWLYEISTGVLLLLILVGTYRKFPFTPLTYFFAWIGIVIIFVGAHYTYGNFPLFNDLRDHWGLSRNHFDRFGHFFQGVVPTIFLREIMIRKDVVENRRWLFFILLSISLAISAGYELFEVSYAHLMEEDVHAFLGTQGDQWDSHWDMLCALSGSIFVLVFFSRWHDRLIQKKSYSIV
jgi:putative membrane protein